MTIISRAQWGARYADGYAPADTPAPHLIFHHSATIAPDLLPPFDDDDAAIRTLERIGQERFGLGMCYTFAVTPVGRIYQGVSIDRASAHTLNHNFDARAIVMVGNYSTTPPSNAMIESIAWLTIHGHENGWWLPNRIEGGHRDFERPGYTECPGNAGEAAIRTINSIITDMTQRGDDVAANADEIMAAVRKVDTNVSNLYEVLEGRVPDGKGGYKPVAPTDSHRQMSLPRLAAVLDNLVTMVKGLGAVEAVERDHVEGIASQIAVVQNDLAALMSKLGVEPTG